MVRYFYTFIVVMTWCLCSNIVKSQEKQFGNFDQAFEERLSVILDSRISEIRLKDQERLDGIQRKLQETTDKLRSTERELIVVNERLSNTEKTLRLLSIENTDTSLSKTSSNASFSSKRLIASTPSHSTIAFNSHLSSAANNLGNQNVVPFDTVTFNEGNAFDPVLHVFTCPTDGIYVFMTALVSEYQQNTATEIVLNGNPLAIVYSAGSSGSHGYDQGFNSVVTRCNAGNRVWVQIHGRQGSTVLGDKWCSFSGFQLA